MNGFLREVLGPRVRPEQFSRHPIRYAMPTALLTLARVLLLVSVFLPYWHMELEAPQYPNGLFLTAHVNTLSGDVREIDGLNHYIGMRPLQEAAKLERQASVWLIVAMVFFMEGAIVVHSRWAALLAIPALAFPVLFLVDLQYWMYAFGQGLDPKAPLSSSVKPFTPTILGEGGIGQFKTYAEMGWGLYLAFAAAAVILAALWFHRRAYKPLLDAARRSDRAKDGAAHDADRSDAAAERRADVAKRRSASAVAAVLVLALAGAATRAGAADAALRDAVVDDEHGSMAPPSDSPAAPRDLTPAVPGSIAARIRNAAPGDTIEIGAGVYRERLHIDRPIRLVGVDSPLIDGEGVGDLIVVTAPDVEIRGFVLRNSGTSLDREHCAIRLLAPRAKVIDNRIEEVLFGIDLKQSPGSVVRGNSIGGKALDIARRGDGLRLWRSDEVVVEDNEFHGGRDAILWYSRGVVLRRNRAHDCRYGFHLMFSDDVIVEQNSLRDNSVGIYLMYSHSITLRGNRIERSRGPSGYGIGLKETDRFRVEENVLAGNRVGIYLDGSPFTRERPGLFRGNTLAWNDIAMIFLPSVRGNVLTENNFVDNLEQIVVAGRGTLVDNDFSRDDRGNFWSDYAGYDADRDGIGDWTHEPSSLMDSLLEREPKLRLFLLSPAQLAIEFVARALPATRPESKFVDDAPLMAPVAVSAASEETPRSHRAGLLAVSLALGSIGAFVLACGREARS